MDIRDLTSGVSFETCEILAAICLEEFTYSERSLSCNPDKLQEALRSGYFKGKVAVNDGNIVGLCAYSPVMPEDVLAYVKADAAELSKDPAAVAITPFFPLFEATKKVVAIRTLVVTERMRGKGVGTALLSSVIQSNRDCQGVAVMGWIVGGKDVPNIHSVVTKLGFKHTGGKILNKWQGAPCNRCGEVCTCGEWAYYLPIATPICGKER